MLTKAACRQRDELSRNQLDDKLDYTNRAQGTLAWRRSASPAANGWAGLTITFGQARRLPWACNYSDWRPP